ncbi:alpha-1A adrenergic receptor-like [Styela clava]
MDESTNKYNTTNANHVRPFGKNGAIASAVFLLPMSVFGLFANLITIIVITRSKKLSKSVFNLMIVSLCVSDLISAIISPLSLHRRTLGYDHWLLPEFFCKLFWAADHWTSYVTSLHILLFACIRLASVKSPTKYERMKNKYVKAIVGVIWSVAFGCGFIPMWIWFGVKASDRPIDGHGTNWPDCTLYYERIEQFQVYVKIAYTTFFYIPMVAILIISPSIAIIIMKRRKNRLQRRNIDGVNACPSEFEVKSQKKENSAIVQLAVIVGSYMLGYIPSSAYLLYATAAPQSTLQEQIFHWNFGTISYILLRLSECLNPIFYNVASSKMRKETKSFLRSPAKKCCSRSTNVHSVSSSSVVNSPSRGIKL